MLLTLDLGNSNLTIGLYEGGELRHHWRLATDHARMARRVWPATARALDPRARESDCLKGVVLALVVPPLTGRLVTLVAKETEVIDYIIAPWLTLEGLRLIWELNRSAV